MHYDVLIIGAGAAGLTAAVELARAHVSALVVDARARIGGRIWSHQEPDLPVPVELGAEFIHGYAAATFALLAKAAAAAVDTGEAHWWRRAGTLAPADALFTEIRAAMQATQGLAQHDLPFEAFLEGPLQGQLSRDACAYARLLAQGFDAADTRRASARALVAEWTGNAAVDAPQFRPLGGYGPLLAALAAELRGSRVALQLQTVVRHIRWQRGGVEIQGTWHGREFSARAKRAIITLPLGVLQGPVRAPGAVRFTPPLTAKRAALTQLAPGPVIKVLLRFRTAFWEALAHHRYRDGAFFHDPTAAFPTVWTTLPVRTPLLAAWAAGPYAQQLAGLPTPALLTHALDSVRAIFQGDGPLEGALDNAWVHDWQRDPFARGAYSYVCVHGEQARHTLAAPLDATLFFAGEATDTHGEAGTVAGALHSGRRAAHEVLDAAEG
jgi:monoamine oxidase